MAFLKIKVNGINAKTNTKGDKESPSKIPRVISTSSNSEFPADNITPHFSILLTNKVLIFSATPSKSKHSLNHECGPYHKLSYNLSMPFLNSFS